MAKRKEEEEHGAEEKMDEESRRSQPSPTIQHWIFRREVIVVMTLAGDPHGNRTTGHFCPISSFLPLPPRLATGSHRSRVYVSLAFFLSSELGCSPLSG